MVSKITQQLANEGSQRRVVIENAAPETVESFLRLLYLDTLPPKTDQGALCVLADLLYANELGPRALGRRYARFNLLRERERPC